MDTRKGGHRYCPSCKQIVETRVLLEGYCQTEVHGIQPRNARSYAEQTLKEQVAAEQGGLRWRYRKISYWPATGKRGELLKRDS